jgi:hypothetical protein
LRKQRKKRRVGRPSTGKRPMIAFRVHQQRYGEIAKGAEQNLLSMSEEAERRLLQYAEWEQQFGDSRKLLAQTNAAIASSFRNALVGQGYQRIATSRGVLWAEPGVDLSGSLSVSVDAATVARAIEPEFVQLITRVLESIAKDRTTG